MAIHKTDDGKWRVDFYIGKKRVKKKGFSRKKEAESYITNRKADYNDTTASKKKRFSKLTFSELAIPYRDKHLANSKAHENIWMIDKLIERWGDHLIAKITTSDARDYFDELFSTPIAKTNEPYAISTVEKFLTYFKRVFNYAIEMEVIEVNPVKEVKFVKQFKKKNKRNKTLSQEQFFKFYDLFRETPWYIKGVALVLWHTGMRISEVLNLKWSEVDLTTGVIVLDADRVKEGKTRTIGLEKEVVDLFISLKKINDRKGANSKDHVFGVTGEKPLSYQAYYRNYRKIVNNTPFSGFNIHDQRHSYTKRKRQEGHDKEVIMVQQGHSTDSMFRYYNDVDVDEVTEMSGYNEDKRDIIESDIDYIVSKMKKDDISLNTIHTLFREKLN